MIRTLQWSLPGVDLHGEARGNAPSAIFLHGFGGSCADWHGIWSRLDPAIPVLGYDLRDFGRSRAHDAAPFAHADDLLALLDREGIERADLIGMSMGGSVAARFALDHPDRTGRLVLISTGLIGWDWSEQWRGLWRPMQALARAGDREGAKALWAAHPLFATTRDGGAAERLLLEGIARYPGDQWIADHQHPSLPDVERLVRLACPTLVLSGTLDLPDFRLIADLIEGCVPDVRRVDIEGRGHMLPLEAPGACADIIGSFLSRPA
ncbi:MAG: alpha/beta fold hydrolase [Sphingobium sp.]